VKIVITGYGSEGGLGIIKSLREAYGDDIHIIGLDTDIYNGNQIFLDECITPPLRESEEYLDFVLTVLKDRNADIFWPIPTRELEFFAMNKEWIEKNSNSKVMIGEYKGIATANNKLKLYKALQTFLPEVAPVFYEVKEKDDFKKYIYLMGYPGEKVCIKRADGAGAAGFRILDARANTSDILFYQNPTNTISNWQEIEKKIIDCKDFPEYMVTEYLPGEEWDCDVLCKDGEVLCNVLRKNLRMSYGMSIVTHILDNGILFDYCKKIIKALNLSYIINISFMKDSNGNFKVLEINPRVPGTIIATLFAGNNYGKMAVDLLMENTVSVNENKTDILLSRYSEVGRIR